MWWMPTQGLRARGCSTSSPRTGLLTPSHVQHHWVGGKGVPGKHPSGGRDARRQLGAQEQVTRGHRARTHLLDLAPEESGMLLLVPVSSQDAGAEGHLLLEMCSQDIFSLTHESTAYRRVMPRTLVPRTWSSGICPSFHKGPHHPGPQCHRLPSSWAPGYCSQHRVHGCPGPSPLTPHGPAPRGAESKPAPPLPIQWLLHQYNLHESILHSYDDSGKYAVQPRTGWFPSPHTSLKQ